MCESEDDQVVVVSPHPDDETLGCGGTLLRRRDEGRSIHWLIITHISEEAGFSTDRVAKRENEIQQVAGHYEVSGTTNLEFPTTRLDDIPTASLVEAIGSAFRRIEPGIVYIPYRNDIHTDHSVVFDAVASCTKWFRYPSIHRVLAYETLSETEFSMNPDSRGFRPDVFVNIEGYLNEKIDVMRVYESETGTHPFPRSESAIRALATYRGATSGFEAAEAFMLLKERVQ